MLHQFTTQAGVHVEYSQENLDYQLGISPLIEQLDSQRGAILTSGFEYPGRYTCWDMGFINPPLAITCKNNLVELHALNQRGVVLLAVLKSELTKNIHFKISTTSDALCQLSIIKSKQVFSEEERSVQPSIFTLIRLILAFFKSDQDPYLGLYGAFGYDLIYQFEELPRFKERDPLQRDMVLYLPDEIYVVNHRKEEAFVRRYDFQFQGKSTQSLAREGAFCPYQAQKKPKQDCDHQPGEYAQVVKEAKKLFTRGDLFEVVPSQTFFTHFTDLPSSLFKQMCQVNPSPYGFFVNLGEQEYLVGASPEMYVRVQGNIIETCPISGTIKRGADAIEDAHNIQSLLDSAKEESELTMCTDVDRNDKSRVCEAGTVQVIGRRQIEMYSRLIHTVDHVQGILRDGFDAVDAFLTHMWVVTVTGAPKLWAMNFIEKTEKSPRKWYGGAVGCFGFNGDLNTGLVLRTVRIDKGQAEIRVGATLLYDSNPEAEEQETRLKASAFLDLLHNPTQKTEKTSDLLPKNGLGKNILLIDHQDSFVHTLANYFRQTGAKVLTVRYDKALSYLKDNTYDLVVLSPGPGKPAEFQMTDIIKAVTDKKIPLFGVCLGMQAIVEYFGGMLDVLDYPMHGKSSVIKVTTAKDLFSGFNSSFTAGRYHSLYARLKAVPEPLQVTALSEDGIVMAVSHSSLFIHAVQFHPETILSLPNQSGMRIISNLMGMVP